MFLQSNCIPFLPLSKVRASFGRFKGSILFALLAVSVAIWMRRAASSSISVFGRRALPKHRSIVSAATAARYSHSQHRRMVNASTPATSPMSANGSGRAAAAAAAYATLASSSEQGLSTAFNADPHAASLSHLSGSGRLPLGYAKTDNSDTHATFLPVIEQSQNDDRSYRLVKLDNGLEALVISDPRTDKSAAGISVRVGHLSDPENAQGMAHFCEHLLFMGTEKYPQENDYNEYLSRNNGQSNAYTAMDETVYYFDVHPPALPGALDRFAQFFIAPLFTDSCTEREILAVDSENKKNLQSDMWRQYQLEKSTSSRQHAYWRFGTGNKQTLWDEPVSQGRNPRSELLDWYGEHYSANVMKLVVLGKGTCDPQVVRPQLNEHAFLQNRSRT